MCFCSAVPHTQTRHSLLLSASSKIIQFVQNLNFCFIRSQTKDSLIFVPAELSEVRHSRITLCSLQTV